MLFFNKLDIDTTIKQNDEVGFQLEKKLLDPWGFCLK